MGIGREVRWGRTFPDERSCGHGNSRQTCGRGVREAGDFPWGGEAESPTGRVEGRGRIPSIRLGGGSRGREGGRGSTMEDSWEGREVDRGRRGRGGGAAAAACGGLIR